MDHDTNRRTFLLGSTAAAAGLLQAQTAEAVDQPAQNIHTTQHDHREYPRDHAGAGGPVASATDRGKLVAGFRKGDQPPAPVVTPDLSRLPWNLKDGVKEFHLVAKHTRREFLPGQWIDVWGYNDSMPGPTIEAVEGDRVRLVLHNELPEPTVLHCHGIELPNRYDGVHGLTQEPIMPGKEFSYEFDLHQNGTFFYHSHGPMQQGMGMAGFFLIHPRSAHQPVVDHDFALMIQEWAILPESTIPNTTSMEFNWFTVNGRSAPYTTPLLVRLGSRVRIRFVNMSPIDHHPMHLHGHTFWITGTEAGRIPETAWIPSNNVLVAVAQAREVEFIANNPGDWVLHCHMFHHMMNHMTVMVGPMGHAVRGMPAGNSAQAGMGMIQSGPALSKENGPSLGRGLGEQQGNERTVRTGPHEMEQQSGHGHGGHEHSSMNGSSGRRVPGYPQDMMGMHGMYSEAELKKLNKPETRGMRRNWFAGLEALHTVVRVLPNDLYDRVMSGKGDVTPGASVPGGSPGMMPGIHHQHGEKSEAKEDRGS
jgi:FtsP/CotA-like multicopper oxidase with cupredoxin domain